GGGRGGAWWGGARGGAQRPRRPEPAGARRRAGPGWAASRRWRSDGRAQALTGQVAAGGPQGAGWPLRTRPVSEARVTAPMRARSPSLASTPPTGGLTL